MTLKTPLPPGRSYEQVKHHYLVEKAISTKLRSSDREERKTLYATMYRDLFTQVPDHPRLTRRNNEMLSQAANESKLRFVRRFINPSTVFVEFGPGDCRFAVEIARRARYVIGVDISDQTGQTKNLPDNLRLIVYDGFSLDLEDEVADVVFSDQLVEHFHPEDTRLHFQLAWRILRKNGRYVLRTPHAFTGPHDVSRYFSDEPEGFHLKEWTYQELGEMLTDLKYSRLYILWRIKGVYLSLPFVYLALIERLLSRLPRHYRKWLSRLLIRELCMVAVK